VIEVALPLPWPVQAWALLEAVRPTICEAGL
jgi:hypothetical protein